MEYRGGSDGGLSCISPSGGGWWNCVYGGSLKRASGVHARFGGLWEVDDAGCGDGGLQFDGTSTQRRTGVLQDNSHAVINKYTVDI